MVDLMGAIKFTNFQSCLKLDAKKKQAFNQIESARSLSSPLFASIALTESKPVTYRDDMFSICYVLVYLLN